MSTETERLVERIHTLQDELKAIKQKLRAQTAPGLDTKGAHQLLLCRLGTWPVAFWHGDINEVIAMARLVHAPDAPPSLLGLLSLRGELVPVLDIAERLGQPSHPPRVSDYIVLASCEGRVVGIAIHDLTGLVETEIKDIAGVDELAPLAPYLAGVCTVDKKTVPVLSIATLAALADLPKGLET